MCLGWWSEISEKLGRVLYGSLIGKPLICRFIWISNLVNHAPWSTRVNGFGRNRRIVWRIRFCERWIIQLGVRIRPNDIKRLPRLRKVSLSWDSRMVSWRRPLSSVFNTIMSQSKSSFKRKLECFPGMIQAQSKGSIDWKRIWRCSPSLVTRLQSLQSVWIPNSSNTSNFWIFRLKRAA